MVWNVNVRIRSSLGLIKRRHHFWIKQFVLVHWVQLSLYQRSLVSNGVESPVHWSGIRCFFLSHGWWRATARSTSRLLRSVASPTPSLRLSHGCMLCFTQHVWEQKRQFPSWVEHRHCSSWELFTTAWYRTVRRRLVLHCWADQRHYHLNLSNWLHFETLSSFQHWSLYYS